MNILKNSELAPLDEGSLDLLVESYSNATRILQIRGLTAEAIISADITTSSDHSLVTSVIPITSIPISLTARTLSRAVKRGALYVKVSLRIEGVVVALLMAGYVAETHKVAYPGGDFEGSTDGEGLIRTIVGTDPAANTEISETVPTGVKWLLRTIIFALTNDATAVMRVPVLTFSDGTNVVYKMEPVGGQQAAQTKNYFYGLGMGYSKANIVTGETLTLPMLHLNAGSIITTATTNLQAADNYGAPTYVIEEWIQP